MPETAQVQPIRSMTVDAELLLGYQALNTFSACVCQTRTINCDFEKKCGKMLNIKGGGRYEKKPRYMFESY